MCRHNTVLAMAGTLSKDMRDMRTKCLSVSVFQNQMARIFSANMNTVGKYVYNHAGSEPRIGESNKYVVFADVKHCMRTLVDYVSTRNLHSVLKAEIVTVNDALQVEVSATIMEAIGWFVPEGPDRDFLMSITMNPDSPEESTCFTLMDRNGWTWDTLAVAGRG